MVGKNQALLAEKAELRRKAELADQTEQELAKRSQVFQKTIRNLVSIRIFMHCRFMTGSNLHSSAEPGLLNRTDLVAAVVVACSCLCKLFQGC